MLLQLEEVALREGAEGRGQPGHDQHHLGLPGLRAVSQGIHDGVQPVQGDHDHDEARQVAADDPEEDGNTARNVIRQPRHGVGPADLQRNLQQNHLHRN